MSTATYPCRENKTSIVIDVDTRRPIAKIRDRHKTTMQAVLVAMVDLFTEIDDDEQAARIRGDRPKPKRK